MITIFDSEDNDRSKEEILKEVKNRLENLKSGDHIFKQERHERIRIHHKIERKTNELFAIVDTIEKKGWDNIPSPIKSFLKTEASSYIDELEKMHRTIRAMRDHPEIEDHLLRGD